LQSAHARVFDRVYDNDATSSQGIEIAWAFACNANHCP